MEERELTPNQVEQTVWQESASALEPLVVPPDYEQELPAQQDFPNAFPALPEEQAAQLLQPLLEEIAGLRRDFEGKIKYDTSKERVIDSLHRELQLHQQGLHFRVLQPVFMDLIALYDDIGKLIDGMEKEPLAGLDQVIRHLRIFQETTEEILRRHGVETFTIEENLFFPLKQRSIKITPTIDPALDKHIARRVRCGFLYEEKLLRHELVEIYKYKSIAE